EEGLEKLQDVVWQNRSDPDSTVLAEMFGSFVEFIKDEFGNDFLIERMSQLREQRGVTPTLQGWLTMAKADALEAKEASKDEIDKEYYLLEAGFDPSVQSNYTIVRLARWIRDSRNRPEEAQKLYEYILENRPGTPNFEYCLVDTAEIQAASNDPEQRAEAFEKFRRVLAEVPSEELQEKAVLGMARIKMVEQDYAAAKPLWSQYLENRSWVLSRPEANYRMAECFDEEGNLADALKIYVSVYANFPGHLDWSTRAYLRTAVVMKERGDDLKSLKVLQDMLKRMGHLDHPGVDKGKELFVRWREEYQAKAAEAES
ncbi:MAG: tetratricopeptide repeat protein, partial [Verrucomicrobiota bacterium]